MALRRVLLMGSSGTGKTTLRQRLLREQLVYHKTQTIQIDDGIRDTPGEYLDHGFFRPVLQTASFEADDVLFVEPAAGEPGRLPPGFSSYFTRPVTGVITKTDAGTDAGVLRARELLRQAGAVRIFEVSALTGAGIEELREYLQDTQVPPDASSAGDGVPRDGAVSPIDVAPTDARPTQVAPHEVAP